MSGLPGVLKTQLEMLTEEETKGKETMAMEEAMEYLSNSGTSTETVEGKENKEGASKSESVTTTETTTSSTGGNNISDAIAEKLELLLQQVTRLTEENEKLKEKISAGEHKPSKEEKFDVSTVLSPQEQEMYKESLPIIQKIAKAMAGEKVKEVQREIEELKADAKKQSSRVESVSEQTFVSMIESAIPNLAKFRRDPRWNTYLTSRIPKSGMTVRDALNAAHMKRDINTIKEIVEDFDPKADSLSTLATPTVSSAAKSLPVKKTIPASARTKISEDFRKGRIDKDRFDKLVAAYELAEKEGRVNFST